MGSRILCERLQWQGPEKKRDDGDKSGGCFEQEMNSKTDTVERVFWLEERMKMTGGQEENQRSRGLKPEAKHGGTSHRKHH